MIDRYVLNSDIVLDNFSGTGTTLYACMLRRIKSIGIELSEAQCNEAKERIMGIETKKSIKNEITNLFDF